MKHPSGPELKGHQNCGPGMIFDHKIQRCISLVEYKKKRKLVKGVSSA